MRLKRMTMASALAISFTVLGLGVNGQAAAEDFDVTAVTCDDVLSISEEEAAFVMLIAYGFVAGENGDDEQSSAKIESAITSALARCEATPDVAVVSTFSS